jgi:DNA-binding GntR family transcriptional regulator
VDVSGRDALVRMSLADAIRNRLREQILSGDLAMGERLTEQGVAAAMGTSAGPVREAFASLTREGLVVSLPHRGTFVSSVSQEEVRGAYAIRARLEPYAFELTSGALTPEIVSELEDLLDGMHEAAQNRDHAAMIGLDMRFHGLFYTGSGNPILAAVWPLVEGTIRKFVAVAGPQDRDYDDQVRQHQKLLDSVRAGDLTAVNHELADHGQEMWQNLPEPEEEPPPRRARAPRRR